MLYIDSREQKSGVPHEIFNLLSKSDITVKMLQSADYAFSEVGIERKQLSDLYHTLYMKQKEGGRLWRQLDILKHTYKQPFLLIEGSVDWSDAVLAGTLNSILLFSNVKLIFTSTNKQSAIEIVKMYNKYGSNRSGLPPPPAVIRGKTVKEVHWGMLQCVRGIGPNAAKKILDEIPYIFTKEDMFKRMLECKLSDIKGLNKEAKEMIVRVFTE